MLTFDELKRKHKSRYEILEHHSDLIPTFSLVDYYWDLKGEVVLSKVSYKEIYGYLEE